jgi:outer membrane murein-binding lipoprotein Lpp
MTSLISMQSSLRSTGTLRSTQTELKTEAEIYEPSMAFAGDPEKANSLTAQAQNLNSSIGKIASDVQTTIQDTRKESASENSKDETVSDSKESETNSAEDSVQDVSTASIYNSSGKLASDVSVAGTESSTCGESSQPRLNQLV